MSREAEDHPAPSSLSLISGILVDLEHLVEQQLRLTRREIEVEIRKRYTAVWLLGVGSGIALLASFLLSLTCVHLLHWVSSPAGHDLASMPLWACYALVGLILAIAGGVLIQLGRGRLNSMVTVENPVKELFKEPVR